MMIREVTLRLEIHEKRTMTNFQNTNGDFVLLVSLQDFRHKILSNDNFLHNVGTSTSLQQWVVGTEKIGREWPWQGDGIGQRRTGLLDWFVLWDSSNCMQHSSLLLWCSSRIYWGHHILQRGSRWSNQYSTPKSTLLKVSNHAWGSCNHDVWGYSSRFPVQKANGECHSELCW